mmetsp:Transcript_7609/g.18322  ORF Transcript_7609/g.18322 Transcript_7609/m.18322 type:complete len:472 (-) Transcript_7609:154-1569(-)
MYDSDLAKILPEWANWSKSKRDKVFKEYQTFCFSRANENEFNELARQASILERDRFLKLVPLKLDARDSFGLQQLMDESWNDLDGDDKEEEDRKALAKDVWATAGTSIVNALDLRDSLIAMNLIELIEANCRYNSRALRKLRKSPKFIPWLKFILEADKRSEDFCGVVPIQYDVFALMKFVIIACSKRFLNDLLQHDIHKLMFFKVRRCCPSLLAVLGEAIEALVKATSDYYPHQAFQADEALNISFQVGNRMLCDRCLEFDLTKERFRGHTGVEIWTDVGEIGGAFANALLGMQLFLRIPTPMNVRRHLGKFGASYTEREPRDPLERKRWSNRYFCKRVEEFDFSDPRGQIEGREIKMTLGIKDQYVEDSRKSSIQCGQCQAVEPEGDEAIFFSKCSRCKLMYYCSRDCQQKHWKIHKKSCKKPAKASLPTPLLNLQETVHAGYDRVEGHTIYPSVFGVWFCHKYGGGAL